MVEITLWPIIALRYDNLPFPIDALGRLWHWHGDCLYYCNWSDRIWRKWDKPLILVEEKELE